MSREKTVHEQKSQKTVENNQLAEIDDDNINEEVHLEICNDEIKKK